MTALPHLRHLAAAALLCAAAAAGAAPLDDIRRQVESGQFAAAYATAQANPQLIGDVHFDFLYGVAAINVGRIPEGLLALERHLAAVPANDRARLELARGYFLLGEYPRARSEFDLVLRYNPPAGVRANIAGYLQAMQLRDAADNRSSARLYAEAGIGYDSNVNGGTYQSSLPIFAGETLDPGSRQIGDGFAKAVIGGQHLMRVTPRLSVFAGGDLDHQENFEHKQYNLTTGGVYAGFTQLQGNALWRLTLSASELMVGGSRYRDTLGAAVEATLPLNADLTLSGQAQYAELRHSQAEEERDGRATSLAVTATQTLPDWAGTPQIGARLGYTWEQNGRARPDLGRDTVQLRLFGSASPWDRLRVAVGLTVYSQRYGANDLVFGSTRKDTFASADLSVNYALDANWSLRLEGLYYRIRSNQDLYDSNRKSLALKIRYQF